MPGILKSVAAVTLMLFAAEATLSSGQVDAQTLTGRAAGSVPKGSVWEQDWLSRKAELEAVPDIELEYFLYGELGNEENMINSLRRNRLQISSASLWGLSASVPEVSVLALPYLFDSVAEADYFYDCCGGEIIQPYLDKIGVTFLGWAEAGWTGFYGSEPLLEPADLAGKTLRTPSTPSVAVFFQSLDVDTVFLGIQDVVPALQTGMVKGGASSLPWYMNAFKDYAPHYTLTSHHYESTVLMAATPWLDRATDSQRASILEAFGKFPEQRAEVRADTAQKMEALRQSGTFVHDLTPEQQAKWLAAAKAAHPAILKEIGGDAEAVYAQVMAVKAEYQARLGAQ